jgi:hypothetical protein
MKTIVYVFVVFIIVCLLISIFTTTEGTSGWFSKCVGCKGGTYSNDNSSSCTQCKAGEFSTEKSDTCQMCNNNSYSDKPGQPSCTKCADGSVTGDEIKGYTKCSSCTPGTRIGGTDEKQCVNCEGNTYSDAYASQSCTQCPLGTEIASDDLNSRNTSSELCQTCRPGYGWNTNGLMELKLSDKCTKCTGITYRSPQMVIDSNIDPTNLENINCLNCPSGLSPNEDHTECN